MKRIETQVIHPEVITVKPAYTETIVKFEANDGEIFNSAQECLLYEGVSGIPFVLSEHEVVWGYGVLYCFYIKNVDEYEHVVEFLAKKEHANKCRNSFVKEGWHLFRYCDGGDYRGDWELSTPESINDYVNHIVKERDMLIEELSSVKIQ